MPVCHESTPFSRNSWLILPVDWINLNYLMLSPLFVVVITQLTFCSYCWHLFSFQDNAQDGSCPAAAINEWCGDGHEVFWHMASDVDAATAFEECYQLARDNGDKSFQMGHFPTFNTCFTRFNTMDIQFDENGNCNSSGGGWDSDSKEYGNQIYIIQDFTVWPDGYSCYEDGSLKKYLPLQPAPALRTPSNTPAIALNPLPTVPETPATTIGCSDGTLPETPALRATAAAATVLGRCRFL